MNTNTKPFDFTILLIGMALAIVLLATSCASVRYNGCPDQQRAIGYGCFRK